MSKSPDMAAVEGELLAGKYRLIKFLSEGNFGAVYRAAHSAYELNLRDVAVKIAKRPMDAREARETFRDALVMAAMADSVEDASLREHFVTVYDAGLCPQGGPLAGHPYVVMELVHGGSLAGCLRAGPFPLRRAAEYFGQLLAAVAFMHSGVPTAGGRRGPLIHRDIKPGNVLVERRANGEDLIKLTDFGLAVEVDDLLGWAQSGGDLAYLPPESFTRDIASPQGDVYMLALVFYEMVTASNPFREVGAHLTGEDDQKRRELRKLHFEARAAERFNLLEENAQIRQNPAVGTVIRAALTVDMLSRPYKNACELRAAWKKALAGGVAEAPEAPWEEARRLTREAEESFAVGSVDQGVALLERAVALNSDTRRVPDAEAVGRTYLVMVQRLLADGRLDDAGRIAREGYRRKRCSSTCRAMALYYDAAGACDVARRFEAEAGSSSDTQ